MLALPHESIFKGEVLRFIFVSPETIVSALFMYITFHTGIALHEMGHHLTAARLSALNDASQRDADTVSKPSVQRAMWLVKQFVLAPYGRASGIKREGLNYYPDAPYNLAVAAAGPRASRNVAWVFLPPAVLLLAAGLMLNTAWMVYVGRLFLGVGVVSLLDFLLADAGKYAEFKKREKLAEEKAAAVERTGNWWDAVAKAKHRMLGGRIQELDHPRLGAVKAPWQFRNCGMGGRHTEKEYPESNVSMQEAMFLILGAHDYQEAQEMTVRLQNRLKQIIENEQGCRVMGIGLEGGLAPYIDRGEYPLPEVRLWAMMKRTIEECGYRPGVDVAIALDPAMSELEKAYRDHHKVPDSVGMYLFWRDKALTVMDRDQVLDLYMKAMKEYDIPILSIEDGFSEEDFEGWQKLLKALGERVFIIGDDLVTTNDETIELAARKGLINTALIKANQIGTLFETMLAMLVALGKGQELVVSHRSKSPNDDMEAQIALAVNSLGLKCGGGANTERLVKYHAITEFMQKGVGEDDARARDAQVRAFVEQMYAYEEPTNAGIPSVGATVELEVEGDALQLKFKGATPLGTSAGAGEAIHLVDSMIEAAEYREVTQRHPDVFEEVEPGVLKFRKGTREQAIKELGDEELTDLYRRAQRYEGKGCLNAVDNVSTIVAPVFAGKYLTDLTIQDIDQILLALELRVARRRGKIGDSAAADQCVAAMQRKQNLGMNAVLSVSLALARAVAHLQGKGLFEVLRENMVSLMGQLADSQGVEVEGSRFVDYVEALRKVNAQLEAEGTPLFAALREMTGIYRYVEAESKERALPKADTTPRPAAPKPAARPKESTTPPPPSPPPPPSETPSASPATMASDSTDPESAVAVATPPVETGAETHEYERVSQVIDLEAVEDVNRRLFDVCAKSVDVVLRQNALLHYVSVKQRIAKQVKRFGLINNHVYLDGNELVVPYLAGGSILGYRVSEQAQELVYEGNYRAGAILTDDYLKRVIGFQGQTIDLEGELFDFDSSNTEPVHVGRIRDMADELKRIGRCANRNEAVYRLRFLVARLSLFSFRRYLSAKNLQSEVRLLLGELMNLLNTPLSSRLPFLIRILVRNISGVVTKPKLIDHLWNDSVDLAEVHVRGSDIVNEIRRSTHHAIGRGTQVLAQAYLDYLDTGGTDELSRLGYPQPGPADEQARQEDKPREIVATLVENLDTLFGSSEIIGRIGEWQKNYEATLIRCEFGRSVGEEADRVVSDGIEAHNRWAFYHHVRIIRKRMADFQQLERRSDFDREIQRFLEMRPDAPSFDGNQAEEELRACVSSFVDAVRREYQNGLFERAGECVGLYERGDYLEAFRRLFGLRGWLRESINQRAFPEQRLLLLELDCLLEEMGYLALRHVSSRHEESGVDIHECLEIIRMTALNLTHNGLHSRQLRDLVDMLTDDALSYREVSNVLTQIQRNYLHILRRLITPLERMREKLGLDEDEMRIALANIQRFLHDLNSMASFTDSALAFMDRAEDNDALLGGSGAARPARELPVLHLSHENEVRALVESEDPAVNVRRWYGGKGSGLVYIRYLGIPTPDAFILPTNGAHGGNGDRHEVVTNHLGILERDISARDGVERRFADSDDPILLAVRGGSVFSMPGMLSTVLFVGMNDAVAEQLAKDDPWYAYDAYRRFLSSYAQAVWDFDVEKHSIVEDIKQKYGVRYKSDLPWEAMKEISDITKETLRKEGFGDALDEILSDRHAQLYGAVAGVRGSWNRERAKRYRDIKGICDSWQTAVIVQEMVSGNRRNEDIRPGMDETRASLTGVIPRTVVTERALRECMGEFKFSAAGEDLVGALIGSVSFRPFEELATYMPMLNRRIRHTMAKLRRFMGTDQDIEFTVDRGVLSVLQARAAEIGANSERCVFNDTARSLARGIGVRGSAFRGLAAFDAGDVNDLRKVAGGRDDIDGVVLVLENPTPDDIPVVLSADALLAAKGGSTSHAAVAVNGIDHKNYHAVLGVDGLRVNARAHEAVFISSDGSESARIRTGDVVSIDGSEGTVYAGSKQLSQF